MWSTTKQRFSVLCSTSKQPSTAARALDRAHQRPLAGTWPGPQSSAAPCCTTAAPKRGKQAADDSTTWKRDDCEDDRVYPACCAHCRGTFYRQACSTETTCCGECQWTLLMEGNIRPNIDAAHTAPAVERCHALSRPLPQAFQRCAEPATRRRVEAPCKASGLRLALEQYEKQEQEGGAEEEQAWEDLPAESSDSAVGRGGKFRVQRRRLVTCVAHKRRLVTTCGH